MDTVTVNRRAVMVLGGIAAAITLVVFFAGFLTAIGMLGKSAGPARPGQAAVAAGASTGVVAQATQVAPGLADLQKKIPGVGEVKPNTATGDVSAANVPGIGAPNLKGVAPGTGPGAPAAAGRAPAPTPSAAPALPTAPPPVADEQQLAPPPPRTPLPGAVPPRSAGQTGAPATPSGPPRASAAAPPPTAQQATPPAPAPRPQPASGAAPPTRLLPSTDGRAPASPAAASAAGASSAPRGAGATAPGFAVQVGAFLTGSHATRLAEDLQKRGHDARVVVETDTSGRPWHIVRVGRFIDRYTALGAANRLKSAEGVPTMVVTELLSGPALR